VAETEINKDGIDESDLDAAANTYNKVVHDALTEKVWNVSCSKKEPITFHGQNKARFTTKRGCVRSCFPRGQYRVAKEKLTLERRFGRSGGETIGGE